MFKKIEKNMEKKTLESTTKNQMKILELKNKQQLKNPMVQLYNCKTKQRTRGSLLNDVYLPYTECNNTFLREIKNVSKQGDIPY